MYIVCVYIHISIHIHVYIYTYTYIYTHRYHIFFHHSSVDGHLGYFYILGIVTNVAMDTGVQVCF